MENYSMQEFALREFDSEMITTRKLLERVPFDKFDWQPHVKSMKLGPLAIHVATLPGMGVDIISKDTLSFDGQYNPPVVNTTADIVKLFEEKAAATRAALGSATDDDFKKNWKLIFGVDRVLYDGVRLSAFQSIMMNHHIHHRAQLGMYLRLNDIDIPGSYGPSADEPFK